MKQWLLLIGLCGALVACGGEKDADKLGDAQLCLDRLETNNAAKIKECLEPISGLNSTAASALRCTAGFMREDLANGERILKGFEARDNNPNSDGTKALMDVLSFTSTGNISTDFENVESTYDHCFAAGSKGATLLASFSYLGMSLVNYFSNAGACSSAPTNSGTYGFEIYDVSNCINGLNASHLVAIANLVDPNTNDTAAAAVQAGIGQVTIQTARLACPKGGNANKDLCKIFTKAIEDGGGESNPRGVAISFFVSALNIPTSP